MNIAEREMLNYRRKNIKSLQLQRETTEKVRTRVVCLVWYTYSSGFASLQGIIKMYLGFWSYMQINSIRPKTGKGDN